MTSTTTTPMTNSTLNGKESGGGGQGDENGIMGGVTENGRRRIGRGGSEERRSLSSMGEEEAEAVLESAFLQQSHNTNTNKSSPSTNSNTTSSGSTTAAAGTPITDDQNHRIAALLDKYGYRLIKENGQRKFCAPAEWNLPLPPRGCELFIGKLPRDIYEDELVPLFEKCGRIYEMRLMMDFSGANRGYAFVTYVSREDAKRACAELNNYEIRRGRHIGVVLSVDNCRLFVGGIPRNRTREDVKEEMSKLTDGVVDVILYPSAADKTKNRGFAFVEYESHRAAAKARRKLLPNRIQLWGNVIAVDWAEPEQDVDEATMATVKVLYVRNLMIQTTEDTLRSAFETAAGEQGSVERVKKMRDFAFVHFSTREQAIRARDRLNGSDLDGAIVEVVLSKPPYQSTQIVRSLKNMQKGGAIGDPRANIVGGIPPNHHQHLHDDFLAAASRHVHSSYSNAAATAVDPTAMMVLNNILAANNSGCGIGAFSHLNPIDPTKAAHQQPAGGLSPIFNPAAAFTGWPVIDPFANFSQGLLTRQTSVPAAAMAMDPSLKFGGVGIGDLINAAGANSNNAYLATAGGRTMTNRGAAGMRSAGFQAMLNNTLRQTSTTRRKFSEPFLHDYILSHQNHPQHQHQYQYQQQHQHHQQMLAHQQALLAAAAVANHHQNLNQHQNHQPGPGVVLIPAGPAAAGIPAGMALWRPMIGGPPTAAAGFIPVIPAGPPFAVPNAAGAGAPPSGQLATTVVTSASVPTSVTFTTLSPSDSMSSHHSGQEAANQQQQQQQQQIAAAAAAAVYPFLVNGGGGTAAGHVPAVTNYQQACFMGFE